MKQKRRLFMKKLLLLIFIILPILVYSDAVDIEILPGGTVAPIANDTIALKNETITINLNPGNFDVEVSYTFMNTGNDCTVTMGFPNEKIKAMTPAKNLGYSIVNFQAFDGKKKLKTYRKDRNKSNNEAFECFDVIFKKGEEKLIVNKYSQLYFSDKSSIQRAKYILKTGALWKGKIENIKVIVKSNLPQSMLQRRIAYFQDYWESENQGKIITDEFRFRIFPENYTKSDNKYYMEFNNIEPDFDIEIMIPNFINSITASSVLKDPKNKYSVKNLIDEDPKTIWAEGAKDSGINEYIDINITPYLDNYAGAYKIKKIGLINGYAINESLFKKNNRVKTMRIDYKNYLADENTPDIEKEGSLVVDLEDSMAKQYIEFKKPILMSTVKITILDVYRGTMWNDTCISELELVPEE